MVKRILLTVVATALLALSTVFLASTANAATAIEYGLSAHASPQATMVEY